MSRCMWKFIAGVAFWLLMAASFVALESYWDLSTLGAYSLFIWFVLVIAARKIVNDWC